LTARRRAERGAAGSCRVKFGGRAPKRRHADPNPRETTMSDPAPCYAGSEPCCCCNVLPTHWTVTISDAIPGICPCDEPAVQIRVPAGSNFSHLWEIFEWFRAQQRLAGIIRELGWQKLVAAWPEETKAELLAKAERYGRPKIVVLDE